MPDVQTHCRFVKYNKCADNIFGFCGLSDWLKIAMFYQCIKYRILCYIVSRPCELHMYTIYKAYEEAKVLCYSVIKHTVDSSYSRTTEEFRKHLLTARISKFLLYSQITRMKKWGTSTVFLSTYRSG